MSDSRERFAQIALQGLLASSWNFDQPREVAEMAWRIADAMMLEDAKRAAPMQESDPPLPAGSKNPGPKSPIWRVPPAEATPRANGAR